MKHKTTQKIIKDNYIKVIPVGCSVMQRLLKYEQPTAYTVRTEGWASDIYDFTDLAISTGYAPFGTVKPTPDTDRFIRDLEKQAYDCERNSDNATDEKEEIQNLLQQAIDHFRSL